MINIHFTAIEGGEFYAISIRVKAVVGDVLTGTDRVHMEEVVLIPLHISITNLVLADDFFHEPLVRSRFLGPSVLLE